MINPPGQSHSAGPRTEFRRTNEGMHIGQQAFTCARTSQDKPDGRRRKKRTVRTVSVNSSAGKAGRSGGRLHKTLYTVVMAKITVLEHCVELRWVN